MKTLFLAAAIATFLGTAGITTEWLCGENGVQLNGIGKNGMQLNGWRTNGYERQGIRANGVQQPIGSMAPVVNAVILPSGETIALR